VDSNRDGSIGMKMLRLDAIQAQRLAAPSVAPGLLPPLRHEGCLGIFLKQRPK
jgi:hypothetical protein